MNFKLDDISFKIKEIEDEEEKWQKTIFLIYFHVKIGNK
jgi:hypothetical protein